MMRLFSWFFLFTFSTFVWGQDLVFQGRVDLGRDLVSLEASPPTKGTLYLLTGAAAAVRVVSEDPFVAEVDFVQGEWQGEEKLLAHKTTLRFEGAVWSPIVVEKKPRQNFQNLVYPYRKFQVAALAEGTSFRVFAVTYLF